MLTHSYVTHTNICNNHFLNSTLAYTEINKYPLSIPQSYSQHRGTSDQVPAGVHLTSGGPLRSYPWRQTTVREVIVPLVADVTWALSISGFGRHSTDRKHRYEILHIFRGYVISNKRTWIFFKASFNLSVKQFIPNSVKMFNCPFMLCENMNNTDDWEIVKGHLNEKTHYCMYNYWV